MKKNVSNFLKLLGLSLLCGILWSCGGGGYAPSADLPSLGSALVISPNAITIAVNNTVSFAASGGNGSYSYSVFSGSGDVLTTTGSYTASSVAGTAVVRVIDGQGQYADAIVNTYPALTISPASQSLSFGATQAFTADGGVGPYAYSIFAGGGSVNLAIGLFTAPASSGSVTVRVTDSIGNTSDANVTIISASAGVVQFEANPPLLLSK